MIERDVLVVVYDRVRLLDVASPLEVFAGAAQALGGGYRIHVAATGGQDVITSAGVRLGVDADLTEVAQAPGHAGRGGRAELS